jgi:hypothetical protein
MSTKTEKVVCRASERDFVFANFADRSFSTPTHVGVHRKGDKTGAGTASCTVPEGSPRWAGSATAEDKASYEYRNAFSA